MDPSKQYRDILDQYQKTLNNQTPTPPTPPAPSVSDVPSTPVVTSTPVVASTPVVTPPPVALPPKVSDPSTKFFKILFILSLLIFLAVAAAVAYNLIVQQIGSNPTSSTKAPSSVTTSSIPTTSASFCELNDQRYQIGQSFAAADGCNTCTCLEDLTISCTELACN